MPRNKRTEEDKTRLGEIGLRLRQARKRKGYSIRSFAKELGVTREYIGHIEAGRYIGSVDFIIKAATLLEVRLDWLLLNEGIMDGGYRYIVSANLYSQIANDYIHHWDGRTFYTYDEAYQFYNKWEPSKNDIRNAVKSWIDETGYVEDHIELEIGLWNLEGESLEFYVCYIPTTDEG